jgi:hypothetical protein
VKATIGGFKPAVNGWTQSIRDAVALHWEGTATDGVPISEPSSRVDYVEIDA